MRIRLGCFRVDDVRKKRSSSAFASYHFLQWPSFDKRRLRNGEHEASTFTTSTIETIWIKLQKNRKIRQTADN